ncbi:MAG: hypothetical protein KBF45_10300 [Cyclobacteriaceae bacterium]|jgi:hypothetical protein|nr:hypothetical protein [Cyclobacteriaceae bacterium]
MKINLKILLTQTVKLGWALAIFMIATSFSGCSINEPTPEDIPELITRATLQFVPSNGGETIIVNAIDPDGDGSQDIEIDGPINLTAGTTYTLTMQLINGLYSSGQAGYDVTAEVLEEGDEHQVFFTWSVGSFNDPAGTGNIDSTGSVNYLDEDDNSRPVGISTMWSTASTSSSDNSFRILLKHQPGTKSDTSTFYDGETDLDITFTLNIN